MTDHNSEILALQKRIGELEFTLIQRDDQLRELQGQLAKTLVALADYREKVEQIIRDSV